jgi:N-formylglutamate amidohydrolase
MAAVLGALFTIFKFARDTEKRRQADEEKAKKAAEKARRDDDRHILLNLLRDEKAKSARLARAQKARLAVVKLNQKRAASTLKQKHTASNLKKNLDVANLKQKIATAALKQKAVDATLKQMRAMGKKLNIPVVSGFAVPVPL